MSTEGPDTGSVLNSQGCHLAGGSQEPGAGLQPHTPAVFSASLPATLHGRCSLTPLTDEDTEAEQLVPTQV